MRSSSCEAHSGASTPALQERTNQEPAGSSGTKTNDGASRSSQPEIDNPSKKTETKKLVSAGSRGKEIGTNAMEEMPCVFTKGDGPDGKRIEEFVKHAGGSDVDHPLRHIVVVNPTSASVL
ncbi:ninja-family protein AFP2-like [Carica papaya]|uniref:ninja-family protein AFP2-like n=1 Tax=Carica papaya TaxID=3649 RepID=UPI000B8CC6FF|nr:ninja-family protein AFP2-like [Carica papaya]